jgi:hypothetical protein
VKSYVRYWRASDSLRASPGFAQEVALLGELVGLAAQDVFRDQDVEQIWACGEADSLVSSLARELDAYVLSRGLSFSRFESTLLLG